MNDLKHKQRISKKTTKTILLSTEYVIIDNDGTTIGTTIEEDALKASKEKKQVYIVKTYRLKTKQKFEGE